MDSTQGLAMASPGVVSDEEWVPGRSGGAGAKAAGIGKDFRQCLQGIDGGEFRDGGASISLWRPAAAALLANNSQHAG